MYHNIDSVEPAFKEALISREFKRVRHDTRGIREHAVLRDDGIAFDATGTGLQMRTPGPARGLKVWNQLIHSVRVDARTADPQITGG